MDRPPQLAAPTNIFAGIRSLQSEQLGRKAPYRLGRAQKLLRGHHRLSEMRLAGKCDCSTNWMLFVYFLVNSLPRGFRKRTPAPHRFVE